MADELIRYSRIKSFIFQPQTYLSFGSIGYNLRDNEIIVIQSLLTKDYFDYSMSKFDINKTNFLFFSDDIDWCKENFGGKENIFFSNNTSDIIDLAAITLCDHNIISNSGFGLWGAVLNKNNNRRVICPSKYLKNDYTVPHFNHMWFPDDFEGVLIGNN